MKWDESIMKGRQFEACMTTFYMTGVKITSFGEKKLRTFFLAMNRLCPYMILISCCLWDQLTESCLSQRERTVSDHHATIPAEKQMDQSSFKSTNAG